MNNKIIKQIEDIQRKEKEIVSLIMNRDNLQSKISELNDMLVNTKESISFRESELSILYIELKKILTEDK